MPSINKVMLMGNLTREPELRRTQSGQPVCEFGIATNRVTKSRDGQEREETCFVDIVVWGKPAETCKTYLAKGRCVFVEGRLVFDQWEDRNTGEKRSRLRVFAEQISFLGGGRQNDAESGQ